MEQEKSNKTTRVVVASALAVIVVMVTCMAVTIFIFKSSQNQVTSEAFQIKDEKTRDFGEAVREERAEELRGKIKDLQAERVAVANGEQVDYQKNNPNQSGNMYEETEIQPTKEDKIDPNKVIQVKECYIRSVFSQGGKQYIQVDFVIYLRESDGTCTSHKEKQTASLPYCEQGGVALDESSYLTTLELMPSVEIMDYVWVRIMDDSNGFKKISLDDLSKQVNGSENMTKAKIWLNKTSGVFVSRIETSIDRPFFAW